MSHVGQLPSEVFRMPCPLCLYPSESSCLQMSASSSNVCSSTRCPYGLAVKVVGSQQLQQLQRPRLLLHNKTHPDHAGQDESVVAVADSLLLGRDHSPEHHTKVR